MGRTATVQEVMEAVERLAPPSLGEAWDRIGLQVGDPGWDVQRVLVSLGVSKAVLEEAVAQGCGMVVAHHPLIFRPLAEVRLDDPVGRLVAQAMGARVAVGVAHTNLDRAPAGLNDWLAELLGLREVTVLGEAAGMADASGAAAMGRLGRLEAPVSLAEWASTVAARLGVRALRYVGDPAQTVKRVVCLGGSGADAIPVAASAEADVLVTGDVKFHDALEALERGLALVDPGHFASEVFMRERLAAHINEQARMQGWRLTAVPATQEADPFRFYVEA